MNYCSGEPVRVYDQVVLGQSRGVVVFSIDDGVYAPEFPADDWAYLEVGVMIDFPDLGLIHFTQPDPDLRLLSRERQS